MNSSRRTRMFLWGVGLIALATILAGRTAHVLAQDTPGVNDAPDITLPSAPQTAPVTPIALAGIVISDPDVGSGNMELEIDIADLDGVGGRSAPAGNYGTFTWGLGTAVTSDIAVATRAALNSALTTFTYTPPAGFSGTARIVFEIDDQGNTGTGGVLSRTRLVNINVCAAGDSNCATNAQPDVTLPPNPTTPINTPISFTVSVSDLDVGAGNMELEIDISDLDGVGGRSVPAGDYGTFTWGLGTAVTTDVAVTTRTALNTALITFTYTPKTGFTGTARIVFEIDDQGNSQTALGPNVLSRTRFIDISVVNPTATPTRTPTPTPTRTPTPTATPTLATLAITFNVQGRPAAPHSSYAFPVQVVIETTGGASLFNSTVNSNVSGMITLSNLPAGPVNVWLKGNHTLAVLHTLTLSVGANTLSASLLREGDCNNDNVVTVADFSILAAAFGRAEGQGGFDTRADLNEDNVVNVTDFALLAANFGQAGTAAP